MSQFHLIVIGAGPGGYTAAIRASQLGMQTAIVESDSPGGVCLNFGCIPTKALLESAHLLERIKTAESFGIKTGPAKIDLPAIVDRSRKIAEEMSKGVQFLLKKNKITVYSGRGRLNGSDGVEITNSSGETQIIRGEKIILAVGARARVLPGIETDGKMIFTSKEALLKKELPESICIVGGGSIGLEFADYYASLGSKVTVLEYMPRLLPFSDSEITKHLERSLKKRNIEIITGVKVSAVNKEKTGVRVEWEKAAGEKKSEQFHNVLIATGIQANTEDIGLESAGIQLDGDRIRVDERYKTSSQNIYAIGDCIPGPALAHVAAMEGISAVEAIHIERGGANDTGHTPVNYNAIPACTYTHPEVAGVGLTEEAAKERGLEIKVGKFPFTANGRARAHGDATGLVKVIAGAKYNEILGVHILGPSATEIIAEAATAIQMEATVETIAKSMHAHPTFSESLMEAAADAIGEAINI